MLGYNWRMTEISALMGITQLNRIEQFINRRFELTKIYNEKLQSVKGIEFLDISDNARHNWFKYILLLKNQDRESLHMVL